MADPEAIYNWQRLDNRTTTSGQPTEKQLADIHAFGNSTEITTAFSYDGM